MRSSPYKKQKIKVMHLIETLDVGGAEIVLADIVNNLGDDFVSMICCLKRTGEIAKRINSKIEILTLGAKDSGNDYFLPFRLAKLIKEKQIDVLHTHNWGVFYEGMLAAMISRVPAKIHMAHGSFLTHPNTLIGAFKKRIRRKVEKLFSLACDEILAVSDELKRSIIKELKINSHKIIVIHNAIKITDAAIFDRNSIKTQLGLDKNEFVICTVGRLAKVKNIPLVLHSIKNAVSRYNHIKLILVGDGTERESLERLTMKLSINSNVTFLGQRSDVKKILSICDLYILSSFSEGISISLLEAMSIKLPVIATKVGGNVEVVADGKTGFLTESNNIEEMTNAIFDCIENTEKAVKIGMNGYKHVLSSYNLDKTINTYERRYKKYFYKRNN